MYLYLAVDSDENTIDFYLSRTRNHQAVKGFFYKALRLLHISNPRVITVDKNSAYYKHLFSGVKVSYNRFVVY